LIFLCQCHSTNASYSCSYQKLFLKKTQAKPVDILTKVTGYSSPDHHSRKILCSPYQSLGYASASQTWVNYPKLGKSGFLWATTVGGQWRKLRWARFLRVLWFFPVSIIPLMLHTHFHLNTLTRACGRSLGTFKQTFTISVSIGRKNIFTQFFSVFEGSNRLTPISKYNLSQSTRL
jgi:hypothetical protein